MEPGPIRRVGPEEYSFSPDYPAPEREAAYITPASRYGKWDYPAVLVMNDRVIISYHYESYEQHPTRAELVVDRTHNRKMKVLPLTWFYGGKELADNPYLQVAR